MSADWGLWEGGWGVWVGVSAQVVSSITSDIPDYKKDLPLPKDPKLRAAIEAGRCEHFVDQMRNFIETNLEIEQETKKDAQAPVERVSNAYFSDAFDKALMACGLSTQHFVPHSPMQRMTKDDDRFFRGGRRCCRSNAQTQLSGECEDM